MRVALICLGLALVLAGATGVQIINLPRVTGAPETATIDNPQPMPDLWPGLLVLVGNGDGTTTTRYIPISYLNIAALCAALGGTSIDLRPLHYGNGGRVGSQGSARGAGGGLNRTAPLAPFVPSSVTHIVGLQF